MFKNIIGQDSVIKVLEAAVRNKRWASSYLFVGSEGVGKRLTALAFAQVLNCQALSEVKSSEVDACGKCLPCRKITQNNHPDVQVIVPESDKASISIDQIRSIQKNSFLKPLEGRQKIYIIDDAGTLTLEAMNCFLKILEEPPSKVIFILVTSNLLMLLETIISRCQVIKFNNLSRENVTAILVTRYGVSKETASLLSSMSGGSVGLAVTYRDYSVVSERENMVKLLDSLMEGNIPLLFQEAERLSKNKDDVQLWLNLFSSLWRDILITRIFSESPEANVPKELLINRDFSEYLKSKGENSSLACLKDQIEIILNTKALIQKNVNPRLALETMFLRLAETENREIVKSSGK